MNLFSSPLLPFRAQDCLFNAITPSALRLRPCVVEKEAM
jgi:hypothetical protein